MSDATATVAYWDEVYRAHGARLVSRYGFRRIYRLVLDRIRLQTRRGALDEHALRIMAAITEPQG